MNHTYHTAIIGAGTAGLAALREVRRHTDDFVIINAGSYGTTCARVGCMPSKALIESANAFQRRYAFEELGIDGGDNLRTDVATALRRVRRLRDHFTRDIVAITDALQDRRLDGHARFVSPDTLEVGGRHIRARHIVIATGSHPIVPDAWRSFGNRIVTSDDLFDRETLPKQLAVIGMGSIGTEIAQALARLGIQVTAFGNNRELAGLTDAEVNRSLVAALEREMDLNLGESAELAPTTDGKVQVTTPGTSIVVDAVLAALGRRPNIEHLGLHRLGLDLDSSGLPPFNRATGQIGDLPVYLAGDVADVMPVLHEAADDGYIAGSNVALESPVCFGRRTPLSIVFCDPNVAIVGKRFSDLKQDDIVIGAVDYRRQGRATLAARQHGILRVYALRENGKLVGAELCAPSGEHLAHLLALAIGRDLTVQDLLRMPFYHPVLEEGLRTALRDASKQLGFERESDLANCNAVGAVALD